MPRKQKDPAFLFYSTLFYEGTRTMLPEERGCFVDLLIYQHQHGFVPNDAQEMSMYCSGVSMETLRRVLKKKFIHTENGYYNEKLKNVIEERLEFSQKQGKNAIVGNFCKDAKKVLTTAQFDSVWLQLKEMSREERINVIEEIRKGTHSDDLANALRTHRAFKDTITIKDKELTDNTINNNSINNNNIKSKQEKEKKKKEKIVYPTLNEVKQFFKEKGYTEQSAQKAFEYYNVAEWKDRNGNLVRNWKQKMIANWMKPEDKIANIPNMERPLMSNQYHSYELRDKDRF